VLSIVLEEKEGKKQGRKWSRN